MQRRWRRDAQARARHGTADLRCEGVLQQRDDLRVLLPLGVVQRRVAILRRGGGRAEVEAAAPGGEGGGWAARRGGAAPAQGPSPNPAPPLAPTHHATLLGPLRHRSPVP